MRKGVIVLAVALSAVLSAAACTKVTAGSPIAGEVPTSSAPAGPAELNLATFGEFGFDELLDDYQAEHPDVTINHENVPNGAEYYPKLAAQLAAGSAPDVLLMEDYQLRRFGEDLADLSEIGPDDVTPERWLDWKYEMGLAKDGTWIGYGVESGPMAIAYRTDLFAAAGLPTEQAEVASLFESWDSFLSAGEQYVAATGKPFFDSTSQIFMAMHEQLETGYFDEDDNLIIESNPEIKANWDRVVAAVGQSAKQAPFTTNWNGGLQDGTFATMLAPPWMLGLIENQTGQDNAGKWAVATDFPDGGGNWGSSYVSVSRTSEYPEAAAELAAWLTAPEQQLKAFASTGIFPSQVEALESEEVLGSTKDYFATPETGQLYATLATKVPTPHHKTEHDYSIHYEAIIPALTAAENGTAPDQAWQQAVDAAKTIATG